MTTTNEKIQPATPSGSYAAPPAAPSTVTRSRDWQRDLVAAVLTADQSGDLPLDLYLDALSAADGSAPRPRLRIRAECVDAETAAPSDAAELWGVWEAQDRTGNYPFDLVVATCGTRPDRHAHPLAVGERKGDRVLVPSEQLGQLARELTGLLWHLRNHEEAMQFLEQALPGDPRAQGLLERWRADPPAYSNPEPEPDCTCEPVIPAQKGRWLVLPIHAEQCAIVYAIRKDQMKAYGAGPPPPCDCPIGAKPYVGTGPRHTESCAMIVWDRAQRAKLAAPHNAAEPAAERAS